MNDYKRVSTPQSRAPPRTEYDDILSTMGMKIRKAVSEGYSVPNSNNGLRGSSPFNRPSLPDHMDKPPSLTDRYSTLDSSSSNLSAWEQRPVQLTTISTPQETNKRKFVDEDNDFGGQGQGQGHGEYFHPQYGQLKFNEEF